MIDGSDSDLEEENEAMLGSGLVETTKLRQVNTSDKKEKLTQAEQQDKDLQWLDENIPQTMADQALPILIDSDDDVKETKLEMSKID